MNLSSPAAVSHLLKRYDFAPAHRLGQNFLVDANILAKIASAAQIELSDTVLEVGTGLGVLTRELADRVGPAGHVVTIERDRRLARIHEQTLPPSEFGQVRHVMGDALTVDLDAAMADIAPSARAPAVVANIPYNITSPLLARLLEHRPTYRTIVVLVQREVARRLIAAPGSPEYGAFTVFAQYHAEIDLVATVAPTVFFPPPKVTSAIVRLRPRAEAPVDAGDPRALFAIVRASFQQRRKTLANALAGSALGWSRETVASVLDCASIDGSRRGETLSLAQFAAIARCARNEFGLESV